MWIFRGTATLPDSSRDASFGGWSRTTERAPTSPFLDLAVWATSVHFSDMNMNGACDGLCATSSAIENVERRQILLLSQHVDLGWAVEGVHLK